ncbi:putative protein c9orf32 [Toxoplasma gondii RUB]|uniref:Alpha N-terminal protein methyltransferase 1 n=1 Tax=Toxoplasma gondii RUB TaxID=935652 RepID=A0A086LZK2_TOXGO|nr:putative protein c9orf32 [Toxoplasma gondii RUB]
MRSLARQTVCTWKAERGKKALLKKLRVLSSRLFPSFFSSSRAPCSADSSPPPPLSSSSPSSGLSRFALSSSLSLPAFPSFSCLRLSSSPDSASSSFPLLPSSPSALSRRDFSSASTIPPGRSTMGENSLGQKYGSIAEAWIDELGRDGEKKSSWYDRARDYWEKKDATVSGMLDGYDAVSAVDLEASLCFLDKVKTLPAYKGGSCRFNYALDCGAGIGRVTKGCLLHRFQQVDMVEPMERFCRSAPDFVASERLKDIFQQPLQEFSPSKKYDCIWLQWCILYLTDADLIDLLKRCSAALTDGGVICVKENIGELGFEIDKQDNSIMRTDKHYKQLFRQAGMRLLLDMRQPNFPKSLFPVNMYCLRPLDANPAGQPENAETT